MNFKAAILLLALLGGCTPSSPTAEPLPSPSATMVLGGMMPVPDWKPPDRYGFDLKASCGERSLNGRFHVVVTDGKVRARALDRSARIFMRYEEDFGGVPSLEALLEEAETARSEGADFVEVAVDGKDGHPTSIEIDYMKNAIDDEACYVISNYMKLIDCEGLCISDATVKAGQEVTIAFAPPKKQIWGIDQRGDPPGRRPQAGRVVNREPARRHLHDGVARPEPRLR